MNPQKIREALAACLTESLKHNESTFSQMVDATELPFQTIYNAFKYGIAEVGDLCLICQELDLDITAAIQAAYNFSAGAPLTDAKQAGRAQSLDKPRFIEGGPGIPLPEVPESCYAKDAIHVSLPQSWNWQPVTVPENIPTGRIVEISLKHGDAYPAVYHKASDRWQVGSLMLPRRDALSWREYTEDDLAAITQELAGTPMLESCTPKTNAAGCTA